MIWLLSAFGLWLAFNVAASYAPLALAKRISPGRLPASLLARNEARRVRFYVGNNTRSYAFTSWAPPYLVVVVFDSEFFSKAQPDMIRFVVAHELGHAAAGHHIKRWLAVVTLAALLPPVRRWLVRQEAAADAYAEQLTGMKKEFFPQLV